MSAAASVGTWLYFVTEAVLRGDIGEARRYAGRLAEERDGELTTPELLAAVEARQEVYRERRESASMSRQIPPAAHATRARSTLV